MDIMVENLLDVIREKIDAIRDNSDDLHVETLLDDLSDEIDNLESYIDQQM